MIKSFQDKSVESSHAASKESSGSFLPIWFSGTGEILCSEARLATSKRLDELSPVKQKDGRTFAC